MIVVQDFETVTFYVLFVYKPTFSVIFSWMKRLHVSSQFNNLFILYISTTILFSLLVRGVYWSEDKQTRNLVSFDPANFEMSKIYQGNFQSSWRLTQLFRDTSAVILQKEQNRWRKFFSSSENAIWSILLKYQEIDVQIQTFTDVNWNILHSCFFERY